MVGRRHGSGTDGGLMGSFRVDVECLPGMNWGKETGRIEAQRLAQNGAGGPVWFCARADPLLNGDPEQVEWGS
jgi:hypothetical protein